MKRARQLHSY